MNNFEFRITSYVFWVFPQQQTTHHLSLLQKKENKSYLQALFGNEIICGNLVIKGLYFGKDKPKLKKNKTIAVFHTTSKHCMLNKICKNLVFLHRVRQLSSTKKKKNLINNLNTILKKNNNIPNIFFNKWKW